MSAGERIDAHQHFWQVARGDYRWMSPDDPVLYRDFAPGDLRPCLERHGIGGTVLVQAAETLGETHFLLELAAKTDFVRAVVGWVDLTDPEVGATLERLAQHDRLHGIRPMIQSQEDDAWMLRPDVIRGLEWAARLGLCFDALVFPRHLPHLRALLARLPELRTVIDHGAKPQIRDGAFRDWAADLRVLAEETGVHCKLSGLTTEAAPDWRTEDLRPYVDHILECFGPERLLWGSDWPVCLSAGGYDAWCEATETLLAPLKPAQRDALYGGTAAAFYALAGG